MSEVIGCCVVSDTYKAKCSNKLCEHEHDVHHSYNLFDVTQRMFPEKKVICPKCGSKTLEVNLGFL